MAEYDHCCWTNSTPLDEAQIKQEELSLELNTFFTQYFEATNAQ